MFVPFAQFYGRSFFKPFAPFNTVKIPNFQEVEASKDVMAEREKNLGDQNKTVLGEKEEEIKKLQEQTKTVMGEKAGLAKEAADLKKKHEIVKVGFL